MNGLLKDVRFGLRMLRKSPGFACAAILILALGIGGVTAMFSTLYSVIIHPLPYPSPDRLVLARATMSGNINPWASGPDYVDYRDQSHSFASLEAFFCVPQEVTAFAGRTPERATSLMASVGLFGTLGVKPHLGRNFLSAEAQDGGPPVAVVSHAFWQKHFAGQPAIAGRSLVVDGLTYEVVGVTPPGFQFIYDVDIWLPLRPQALGPRRFSNWWILGRLKEGVSLATAQSEVDVISANLERSYPDTNTKKALLLTPLQGAFTEQYRSSFGMLGGGAAAILLIACANAAGLLVARGVMRRGELAVRAALGASQSRLMRLLLIEALILATAAALVGTAVAVWMQQGLLLLLPVETLLLRQVGFSFPMLVFVLTITVLTGLGFGLLPAWRARQINLVQDLKASGRGSLQAGVRLRRGLVVGQLTVSFVLLVVAGLLVRSFYSLHQTHPGFNPRNLLTVEVPLSPNEYSERQRVAFFSSLLDEIRATPGVISAAAISQLPLRNPYNNVGIFAANSPPANPMDCPIGNQRALLPGYFPTMGIPLVAGRDLRPEDSSGSNRVVIISQELAKTLFPNQEPLGQQVVIDGQTPTPWTVVGVVGDVKENSLRKEAGSRGTFYRAYGMVTPSTMRLAIRTSGDPLGAVSSLQVILRRLAPTVPLAGPRTMEAVMANATIAEKAEMACLLCFSVFAVTLAAVGIYSLLAYLVTKRRRDIGIRMALGATRRDIAIAMAREAALMLLVGLVVGGLGALGAARLVQASLYSVGATDPVVFVLAGLVLFVATGLATWFPTRRAAGVEPMEALRYE